MAGGHGLPPATPHLRGLETLRRKILRAIRWKRTRGPVLLVLGSLALCGATAETILRHTEPHFYAFFPAIHQPVEDAELRYRFRGNVDTVYDGVTVRLKPVRVRTNALGFRDTAFRQAKPDGEFRVLSYGDSFTFGDGVPAEDTYSRRLERRLDGGLGGRVPRVYNLGLSGYDNGQILALVERTAAAYDPDLILVGVLGAKFPCQKTEVEPGPLTRFGHAQLLNRHAALLRWIGRRITLRQHIAAAERSAPPDAGACRADFVAYLERLAAAAGERPVMLVLFRSEAWPFPGHELLETEARRRGVPVLDTHAALEGMPLSALILDRRDPHPSVEAHARIADLIAEGIRAAERESP